MIRLPAEWEPQAAVLIAWPEPQGDFNRNFAAVEDSYRAIAETVSRFQRLFIVCRDQGRQRRIERQLRILANIDFIHAETNDIWVRDTAFLTVENNGRPQLLNFRFNGWGEKYPHELDNALNGRLLAHPFFGAAAHGDIDFVLEGGSIDSDGAGALLTTRRCLLNPNRNRGLNQAAVEARLQDYFGADRIFWLDQNNLAGDDTDAHIDTLARFCSEDTIAYTACLDPEDVHYHDLNRMRAQLQALRTRAGRPYRLMALPMPTAVHDAEGNRLPANYANFLIINGAVLAPFYDDPMDQRALDTLSACFPRRQILPVPCRPLVHQYGSLHCMTMQFPANLSR